MSNYTSDCRGACSSNETKTPTQPKHNCFINQGFGEHGQTNQTHTNELEKCTDKCCLAQVLRIYASIRCISRNVQGNWKTTRTTTRVASNHFKLGSLELSNHNDSNLNSKILFASKHILKPPQQICSKICLLKTVVRGKHMFAWWTNIFGYVRVIHFWITIYKCGSVSK